MQEVGGSIPPGSTTFSFPPPFFPLMKQAAKLVLILSIAVTAVGLVVGLGGMLFDFGDFAFKFLMLVPFGFLFTFASLTVWVLLGGD